MARRPGGSARYPASGRDELGLSAVPGRECPGELACLAVDLTSPGPISVGRAAWLEPACPCRPASGMVHFAGSKLVAPLEIGAI